MASNTQLNLADTVGDKLLTKQVTHDGDTAKAEGVFVGIITGTEDSYTYTVSPGGAGDVDAGTPRVTLAGDDAHFGAVGAASDIDGVVHGQLRYIADQLVTIDSDTNDIKTAIELLDNAVDGNYLNVNLNLAGADAGKGEGVLDGSELRVTLATDDDGVAHLATIAGDTTSLDGKDFATQTTLATIDTDTGNIAAGFAAEGSPLASGVLVQGDDGTDRTNVLVDTDGHLQVDVLTGGGAGTEYTEDAAAAANPVGGAMIVVREDARAGSLTSTDGDNVALRGNNNGELYTLDTDAVALLTTIDSDTNTIQSDTTAIKTAVELLDNAVYVDDADWTDSTSSHVLVGGLYQSSPQSITDGDVGPLQVNANGQLIVDLGGNNDVTITSGTVTTVTTVTTCSTVTNLSQLGGQAVTMGEGVLTAGCQRVTLATDDDGVAHLATIAGDTTAIQTAVEIIDDWDESDRAKVNIIAGQAGIAGGTGADGATVPRVTLATDVGLPAGTNTIGGTISHSQTDSAYDGTTSCTVKRFKVLATADDTEIIPAPTGTKKLRVRGFNVLCISTTGTTIYFETETTHSAFHGTSANPIPVGVDADGNNHGGFFLPFTPDGDETADADEALHIRMPGGAQPIQVSGSYIEVA